MMGTQAAPDRLFYDFCLGDHVPADHLLRQVDRFLDLGSVRRELAGHYSSIGRPSVDPELMIRMLIVGYCSANLEDEWKTVRNYFEVLEILDARYPKRHLKVGTNHCENFNKEAKAAWRPGRRASIALIEQRLVARCGYRVQVRGRRLPEVSDAAG